MLNESELGVLILVYASLLCKKIPCTTELEKFERLMQKQAIARNKPEELANMRQVLRLGRERREA